MRFFVLAVGVFLVCFTMFEGLNADDSLREEIMRLGVEPGKVDAAVAKGVAYLKRCQSPDGSWKDSQHSNYFSEGLTALCAFALVKSGETIDCECIQKALNHLKDKPLSRTYSVAALVLFLTSLATPPPVAKETQKMLENPGENLGEGIFEPYEKRLQKQFEKLPDWVKNLLDGAVKWLVKNKGPCAWGYPGPFPGNEENHTHPYADFSNTQYTMLALYCAMQVGISVPKSVFDETVQWLLENQEQDGPQGKPFRVPAADLSIETMKRMEKEILEGLRRHWEAQVKAWKGAKEKGQEAPKLAKPRTELIEIDDPYRNFSGESLKMNARGWCYRPRVGEGAAGASRPSTGSMTTSGITSLIIAKSQMERSMSGSVIKKVNQGIRDGFAWLAENWSVKTNPKQGNWHYYFLYGLERCGILGLVEKVGEHNWYKEGAEYLLAQQDSDGWWGEVTLVSVTNGVRREERGNKLGDTCFALLFLLRATTPVVKPPGQMTELFTGKDLFKDRE